MTAVPPLLLLALTASAVLVACQQDGQPAPGPEVTATTTATSTPPREGPPPPASVAPKPSPSGTPEPPALTGDILGWFTDPRPATGVPVRSLPAAPPSAFAPYDRDSAEVVLYDTQTMAQRSLGPGGYASFSPDGTRLAWVTGTRPYEWDELRVLDLRTGDERVVGPGRTILWWIDEQTLLGHERGNDLRVIDVVAGTYGHPTGIDPNNTLLDRAVEAGGYRLERTVQHDPYPYWRSTYRVTHLATGGAFTFDAYRAVLAPDGVVVLATVSEPPTRSVPPPNGPGQGTLTTNLFMVDPAKRRATFVATSEASYPNTTLAASAYYIAWQERACEPSRAMRLYDRDARALFEVTPPIQWPTEFTPNGLLASGFFGAKTLIDPATLSHRVVLPEGFSDVDWTPDYRYAVVSAQLGHGGPCG